MNLIEIISLCGVAYLINYATNYYIAFRENKAKDKQRKLEEQKEAELRKQSAKEQRLERLREQMAGRAKRTSPLSESMKNECLQATAGRYREKLSKEELESISNMISMSASVDPQYPTPVSFQIQLTPDHLKNWKDGFDPYANINLHGVLPGTTEEKLSPSPLTKEEKAAGIAEIWRNKDGQCHREDGPAVIYASGAEEWYWEDKFTPGPTERYDNRLVWRDDKGECHREFGPAILYKNGKRSWCQNGELHRADGPAVIYADGTEEWWWEGTRTPDPDSRSDHMIIWRNANGDYHQDHGPAMICREHEDADFDLKWYQNGVLHRLDDGPVAIFTNGVEHWGKNGMFHRVDGPAVVKSDGTGEWYWENEKTDPPTVNKDGVLEWRNKEGKPHREHGPAIVHKGNELCPLEMFWYQHGKPHNDLGPAKVFADTIKHEVWYWDGYETPPPSEITEEELVWKDNEGRFHRDHGPAIIRADGRREWCQYNKLHCVNGPAVIWSNGSEYWIDGRQMTQGDFEAIQKAKDSNNLAAKRAEARDDLVGFNL